MVTVAAARERARKRVEQDQRTWAAIGGADAALQIVLHPPTERAVLQGQAGVIAWVQSWRALAADQTSVRVYWEDRQWPSVGAQRVPVRCVVSGADTIAAFAGASIGREWCLLRDRASLLRSVFASKAASTDALAAAIRTHGRAIRALSEADFTILLHVVGWLSAHPYSGWRIRQLPIHGIDTKWLGHNRTLVESLHAAVTGRASLGLLEAPVLVRVRFLDPVLRPGGLVDLTAPIEQLAALPIAPTTVFVFENLETVLAMPELPGAVVVHGSGYAAGRLRGIPWVASGRIVYWGDLDSDGFAILHAVRSSCADVTSVLMDETTLLAYRDLWVPEPTPAGGGYGLLTADEASALGRIRSEGNVRLEQERIPWQVALDALTATLPTTLTTSSRTVLRPPEPVSRFPAGRA
ncbi:DUF3322 and DUF2220 domain-containing protein [Cryobacterium frigoriphilum]|uniref:DUF3322 and DUF2220 domain-containing protein n=2 Tax=Cryobacterium frigoriphilum TaxID=1259150 RepID=A0A4R9A588_9MICO|nr:DUF3322 and DUF2220 domain-containing protein [Cryobacterium frigoriphilum]